MACPINCSAAGVACQTKGPELKSAKNTMTSRENFLVTTTDKGPVVISPRVRNDLTWLVQDELLELPRSLSRLVSNSKTNNELPLDIWKHFPSIYQAHILFIDQRAGVDISYPEAQKLYQAGKIPVGSPFMSAGGGEIEDKKTIGDIYVYTRPRFANRHLSQTKWGERDSLLSIAGVKHEFSHMVQHIFAEMMQLSESIKNGWPHSWVAPLIFSEGYARTHGGSTALWLKDKQVVFKPLLSELTRFSDITKGEFKVNEEYVKKILLNSRSLQGLKENYADVNYMWKIYIISHLSYLSIIGLRSGLSPKDLLTIFESTEPVEVSMDDMVSTSMTNKKGLLSIPQPQFIRDEADQIELEMQLYYYRNYGKMAEAASETYDASQNSKLDIPKSVTDLNIPLLLKVLKGHSLKDFTIYLNQILVEAEKSVKNSQYKDRLPFSLKTRRQPMSIYSPPSENTYFPIIQRQLFMDGISDDIVYGQK